MAAPRPIRALIFIGLGIAGCRGTPPPAAPPQAPAVQKAPATPPPATPVSTAAAPQEKPAKSSSAVVVDPGVEGDGTPASLVEAARAEKERKARAGKPSVVINDKNLPRYASKGQITIAEPKEKKGAKGAKPAAAPAPPVEVRDEAYWRNRARDIRERWHQAAEDVKKLEQKSTELRQKFYMENDLFVRDNQIKPDWDRVLDRLRQARLDEEEIKQELDAFLEEGRGAGAMPAWLDEGVEAEPGQDTSKGTSKRKEPLPPAQSIEPPVLNDDGGHGDLR